MAVVEVKKLRKDYQVHKKEPGLWGSVRSVFSRKYETVRAVDGVSFEVGEGELVGFIGPNGAGKTTTLKVLSGLLYPTDGWVSVLGFRSWEREELFQKQFSLVMGQKNQLWWDLPAMETFILNKEIYEISEENYKKTLGELVELLEVKDILKVQVRKLSLGQRMKCELIAALLHSPKVLFLDEPTIGLDVVMQKKMRDFIKVYNKRYKATILLTSHYMGDVKELCERVMVIDEGKIGFDGKLSDLVRKYASEKVLRVVFSEEVDARKLADMGKVTSFSFPEAVIEVPRKKVSKVAAEVLENFEVADLNVEEVAIEDIIREVFNRNAKSV
jgi:ABC-2 type transport system ATP-binding protein